MKAKNLPLLLIVIIAIFAGAPMLNANSSGRIESNSEVPFITAEDLKSKLERKESVSIIDVRGNSSYVDSNSKIAGAIHISLRRLRSRLDFPPLKSLPRDSEVVTYCACPADEASIRAAEILTEAGFKRVRVLKGGWRMWLAVNGPVGPRPKSAGR
jgi:rhodanese-related sulfurtransferase